MKFEISRQLLDATLQSVSRGLSTKTPMPILNGVFLTAKNSQLIFVTTNKDISIQVILEESEDLEIEEEGSCVVPGKYFVDIVKKIDGERVQFILFESTTIKIFSKNSDFTLIAYDKYAFPKTSFEPSGEAITLTCKELKQITRQTSFACAIVDARVILTGINFDIRNNDLTVIATDSYRLAKKTAELADNHGNIQINIPCKSLEEFTKILPDSSEELSIYVCNNHVLFVYNNLSFMSRLIDGMYPKLNSLFPTEFILRAKFNRAEMIAAVDRASLFTDLEKLSIVRLNFKLDSDFMEIASTATEIGKVVETIAIVDKSDNSDFQIAFPSKYLLDAIKAFDCNEITMSFTGETKAALVSSDDQADLAQLLIPVKVF